MARRDVKHFLDVRPADNIFTFKKHLRPFVEYLQSGKNGFQSTTLSIADGFEYAVYEGE